ncbi:MAG: hypothetical protein GDA41_06185 [Rhodospirillales bacterium]|nr:hypothetical protein [Rhodospirillales bacterium]
MKATDRRGDDAKAISRIAKQHFGNYKKMFAAHGWELEDARKCMLQAGSRIKERYGSVAEFEKHFDNKAKTLRPLHLDDRK